MGTPYLSEIRIVSFNYPPKGWAFCNGQILPINQNQALFALMGTTYGGNGQSNFALPNLQGTAPLATDFSAYPLGATGGEATHTLTLAETPAHVHTLQGVAAAATNGSPIANALAEPVQQVGNIYGPPTQASVMAPQAIAAAGGSQPHNNTQPYLVLSFVIALQGIFPSQN